MRLTVWVQGWRHECCGEPFSIGSIVHWKLAEPDHEYVDTLFRPELGVRIDRAEDRHGALTDPEAPETTAVVTAIRGVHVRYAPSPDDEGVTHPVPGSAELTDLDRSDGDEMESEGFAGYLVEIRPLSADEAAEKEAEERAASADLFATSEADES